MLVTVLAVYGTNILYLFPQVSNLTNIQKMSPTKTHQYKVTNIYLSPTSMFLVGNFENFRKMGDVLDCTYITFCLAIWSGWSAWESCESGATTRQRNCLNFDSASNSENYCTSNDSESTPCSEDTCAV